MLANLGLDSLSLIQLTGRVKATAGVDLPTAELSMTTTVEQMATITLQQLQAAATHGEGEPDRLRRGSTERSASKPSDRQQSSSTEQQAIIRVPVVYPAAVRSGFERQQQEEEVRPKEEGSRYLSP